jgi:ribose-phosphate pyrophosphokinase
VLSPDAGGIKRAQIFRELLQRRIGRPVELAFIEKRRALDVVSTGALVGDTSGREVIVIDDLCASGGTLIRAGEICRRAGAAAVHAAVTHVPHAPGVSALLASDSAYPLAASAKLTVLSTAPLFGQALRRTLAGRPLAPLLERWPVGAEE